MECDQANSCEKKFDTLFEKIDRIDVAIRGNGKPGIQTRLDRLEQKEGQRSRFVWLLVGVVVSAGISLIGGLLR